MPRFAAALLLAMKGDEEMEYILSLIILHKFELRHSHLKIVTRHGNIRNPEMDDVSCLDLESTFIAILRSLLHCKSIRWGFPTTGGKTGG